MKKITLLLAGIILLVNSVKAQKAFEKGNVTIDLGVGLGIYGTKLHEERDVQVWTPSGVTTIRETNDTTDGAAATIFPLKFEYGITNWLGIGARFAYSKYIAGSDSTNNTKPTVTGLDAGLILNFHFIKTKRFDLPLSVTIGYSNFRYKANDAANSIAKDNGLNYGVALIPRIYFGDHIGIFFNLGYVGYNYPSMLFSNNKDSNLNEEDNYEFKFKFNGANLGLGLVLKF